MKKDPVRYEDAAEKVRITKADGTSFDGWLPVGPTLYCFLEEHPARYYAAQDFPCACGGRHTKCTIECEACYAKKQAARWEDKHKAGQPFNGVYPLVSWDDDQYIFNEEDLYEYLHSVKSEGIALEDVQLCACRPNNGPCFSMSEFLCDDLPEDGGDLDDADINKTVNDWIVARAPFSYSPASEVYLAESFKAFWDEIE